MLPRRDRPLDGDPLVGGHDGLDLNPRIDRHEDRGLLRNDVVDDPHQRLDGFGPGSGRRRGGGRGGAGCGAGPGGGAGAGEGGAGCGSGPGVGEGEKS